MVNCEWRIAGLLVEASDPGVSVLIVFSTLLLNG
jgi:hypothetical protein